MRESASSEYSIEIPIGEGLHSLRQGIAGWVCDGRHSNSQASAGIVVSCRALWLCSRGVRARPSTRRALRKVKATHGIQWA